MTFAELRAQEHAQRKAWLERTIAETGGNIYAAAKVVRVTRQHLYKLLGHYHVDVASIRAARQ